MQQIFGDFIEPVDGHEYLKISFSPTSIPLQQRWRNNGLSADFLADYWATFFPDYDEPSKKRQQEVKGMISYIANELLENIMKFNFKGVDYAVTLSLHLYQNAFRFYANNALDPQDIAAFQTRIQTLLTQDPQMLYLQQLELNAADEHRQSSHLGLLTMLNDYGAQLAWKFEPQEPELVVVTTMVRLKL